MSKWGQQALDANPDMVKMRRRVKSEREWRFYYPTAVAYDQEQDFILVADCQRGGYRSTRKIRNIAPQFNL